jgi:tetratricopeptide (TPR) repeat protein
VNYCPECGFKVEGEFKFCPNCGSQINSSNKENDVAIQRIICNNCGEENPINNTECFSCGIPLKESRNKKQTSTKQESKKNVLKKSESKNFSDKGKTAGQDKVLDNKKILLISSAIVVIFIFALIFSGVFDSGIQKNTEQMNNQSSASGVNLAYVEEIARLEEKVKTNPDDLESTLHLAHLLQDSGLLEKAITNYKKYLARFPENADARVDMAICFFNLGDNATAISEMESAIKYQPKHQIAYLNLGIVNLTARNIEASKIWFEKTVELDPNSEAGKRAQELLNSH